MKILLGILLVLWFVLLIPALFRLKGGRLPFWLELGLELATIGPALFVLQEVMYRDPGIPALLASILALAVVLFSIFGYDWLEATFCRKAGNP